MHIGKLLIFDVKCYSYWYKLHIGKLVIFDVKCYSYRYNLHRETCHIWWEVLFILDYVCFSHMDLQTLPVNFLCVIMSVRAFRDGSHCLHLFSPMERSLNLKQPLSDITPIFLWKFEWNPRSRIYVFLSSNIRKHS